MIYIVPVAFVVGLLMYLLSSHSKAQDIGRLMMFCAMLALFIALAPSSLRLFH